jgi:hypothetical protein
MSISYCGMDRILSSSIFCTSLNYIKPSETRSRETDRNTIQGDRPKRNPWKPTETQSRETGRNTIHGDWPKHNPVRHAETQSRENLSFHCYRGSHCMSIDTVLIHWISLGHCCFHTEHSVFNATVNFNAVIVTYYYTLFAAVMSNSRAVFTLHMQPRAKEE